MLNISFIGTICCLILSSNPSLTAVTMTAGEMAESLRFNGRIIASQTNAMNNSSATCLLHFKADSYWFSSHSSSPTERQNAPGCHLFCYKISCSQYLKIFEMCDYYALQLWSEKKIRRQFYSVLSLSLNLFLGLDLPLVLDGNLGRSQVFSSHS